MLPAFKFSIGHQINQKFVTFGTYDDGKPSLAMATTGGKILLHSPHDTEQRNGEMPHTRFLNFNKKITAIASGNIRDESDQPGKDLLFVGTQSTLLAYDVERNSDVFFREVPDGVNSLTVGRLSNMRPLAFAGGNCSVLGFTDVGAESFWTVTGDNVSAMTLCDVNNDGLNELVVGSEDYEIRFFQNEELMCEQTEADKVDFLHPVDKSLFGYGLANGTVGVYTGPRNRLWRVKTKNKVTALAAYDLNSDGVPEIISGWSSGQLNVRNVENGETLYKSTFSSPIASLLCGDYRLDGKQELIVCTTSGEISGFLPADFELLPSNVSEGNASAEPTGDQKVLDEMQKRKVELSNELRAIEKKHQEH